METKAEPGTDPVLKCSSCDASSARCWCVDCEESLCDACVSAHRRVKVTRSHQIVLHPPDGGDVTPAQFCRLHPSETLQLFCFTCNQRTCRDCQLEAHRNHSYQFVSETLVSLKKQLQMWVQPIRTQEVTVRQSLKDMETRLQDVCDSGSQLKSELLQSFQAVVDQLKNRLMEICSDVRQVLGAEHEKLQRRMMKVKQLQQQQQVVLETAEKAQHCSDLMALLTYAGQIESQLKAVLDQDPGPPQTMSQLTVVTDRTALDVLLKFGTFTPSGVTSAEQSSKGSWEGRSI